MNLKLKNRVFFYQICFLWGLTILLACFNISNIIPLTSPFQVLNLSIIWRKKFMRIFCIFSYLGCLYICVVWYSFIKCCYSLYDFMDLFQFILFKGFKTYQNDLLWSNQIKRTYQNIRKDYFQSDCINTHTQTWASKRNHSN